MICLFDILPVHVHVEKDETVNIGGKFDILHDTAVSMS
jgi:hypothetical protein